MTGSAELLMFQAFDKDGDGLITEAELAAIFCQNGAMAAEDAAREARRIMMHFDVNQDGGLQKAEFAAWWQERTGVVLGSTLAELSFQDFNAFDKDGDGSITEEELAAVLSRGGAMTVDEAAREAARIMATFDINNDGRLQMDEFVRWWQERTGVLLGSDAWAQKDPQQDWLQVLLCLVDLDMAALKQHISHLDEELLSTKLSRNLVAHHTTFLFGEQAFPTRALREVLGGVFRFENEAGRHAAAVASPSSHHRRQTSAVRPAPSDHRRQTTAVRPPPSDHRRRTTDVTPQLTADVTARRRPSEQKPLPWQQKPPLRPASRRDLGEPKLALSRQATYPLPSGGASPNRPLA